MITFDLTREEFFDCYLETRFYLQRGALRGFEFGWNEINELLYIIDPGSRAVRLFQNGPVDEELFVERYVELGVARRRIVKEALYRIMAEGGTLVMNRLELVSSTIRRLCLSVSALCGAPSIANGYVAVGGSGSFGKHWDTHDVFAVQLLGRKRWTLYEPSFALPTRGQTSRQHKDFCPAEPIFDEILEAGDVLYVPRGWWHEARPIGEETCHVAIGTHGPTLGDYAVWCCQRYLHDHLACRRSARLRDSAANDLDGLAGVVASVVANPVMFEEFQRGLLSGERLTTPFQLEHFIASARHPVSDAAEISISSMLGVEVDRRYLPVNGAAAPRSSCERAVLERLALGRSMRIGDLVSTLTSFEPGEVRAAVRSLVQSNRALMRS